jgi:hypothetical protein
MCYFLDRTRIDALALLDLHRLIHSCFCESARITTSMKTYSCCFRVTCDSCTAACVKMPPLAQALAIHHHRQHPDTSDTKCERHCAPDPTTAQVFSVSLEMFCSTACIPRPHCRQEGRKTGTTYVLKTLMLKQQCTQLDLIIPTTWTPGPYNTHCTLTRLCIGPAHVLCVT